MSVSVTLTTEQSQHLAQLFGRSQRWLATPSENETLRHVVEHVCRSLHQAGYAPRGRGC